MALSDALKQGTSTLKEFAEQLQAVSAAPVRLNLGGFAGAVASSDSQEADAIKRGQRPETLAALRKALA